MARLQIQDLGISSYQPTVHLMISDIKISDIEKVSIFDFISQGLYFISKLCVNWGAGTVICLLLNQVFHKSKLYYLHALIYPSQKAQ